MEFDLEQSFEEAKSSVGEQLELKLDTECEG